MTSVVILVHDDVAPAKLKLTPRIFDGLSFTKGQTAKIRVPVIGHPVPTVTWYKNGEILRQMERVSLTQDDSCTILAISDCQRSDRGEYGVRIENYLGIDEATFAVNVTGMFGYSMLQYVELMGCHISI